MFKTAVIAIAIVALFTSPSALKIADATEEKRNTIINPKVMLPYANAYSRVSPPPINVIICGRSGTNINGATILIISVITIACNAALLTNALFLAPIALAIKEFAPDPIPFPNPITIKNKGVINPIAAKASAPRPATHTLSAMLYAIISNIEAIIGTDSLLIAFFGSPLINSMLECFFFTSVVIVTSFF